MIKYYIKEAIKYLGINVIKDGQILYRESYKTLLGYMFFNFNKTSIAQFRTISILKTLVLMVQTKL